MTPGRTVTRNLWVSQHQRCQLHQHSLRKAPTWPRVCSGSWTSILTVVTAKPFLVFLPSTGPLPPTLILETKDHSFSVRKKRGLESSGPCAGHHIAVGGGGRGPLPNALSAQLKPVTLYQSEVIKSLGLRTSSASGPGSANSCLFNWANLFIFLGICLSRPSSELLKNSISFEKLLGILNNILSRASDLVKFV